MAARAAKAEVTNPGARKFKYKNHTYTVPAADEWDLAVLEHWQEGNLVLAIKYLLGEAQWKVYKARHPKATELSDFVEAMFADVGVEPGE